MKRLALLFVLGVSATGFTQVMPEAFLPMLPQIPQNTCPATEQGARERSDFEAQVGGVERQMSDQLQFRQKQIDAWKKANDAKAMAGAVNVPGFKGLSEDQLKNMTPQQKQQMAMQLAAQKMASGQAPMDPKKISAMTSLTQQQSALTTKLMDSTMKLQRQFAALDTDVEGQQRMNKIKAEEDKLQSMLRGGGAGCGALAEQEIALHNARVDYCTYMSPKYNYLVQQQLTLYKTNLPDEYKLEDLVAQLMKTLSGVETSPYEKGKGGIESLMEYAGRLKAVYQFVHGGLAEPRFDCGH
ncbi:MAG: hypothetical protein WCE75_09970 [Terracidiphilus sp.]